MTEALIQGTDEWRLARCGSLGASRVAEALAKTKTGWGATRANVMADLVIERLTGVPVEGFVTDAMRWGTEQEPVARQEYEERNLCPVEQVGLIRHPTILGSHASPDGLVEDIGLLEIKCPQAAAHLDTLLSDCVPTKYETQIQWQLCCTGRAWCDYVSFNPKFSAEMSLFVKRIYRDDRKIDEIEKMVAAFLAEVDQKVVDLRARYVERRDILRESLQASAEMVGAAG